MDLPAKRSNGIVAASDPRQTGGISICKRYVREQWERSKAIQRAWLISGTALTISSAKRLREMPF